MGTCALLQIPTQILNQINQPGPFVSPGDNWYTPPLLEEFEEPPGVSLEELPGVPLNVLFPEEVPPGPPEPDPELLFPPGVVLELPGVVSEEFPLDDVEVGVPLLFWYAPFEAKE